MFYDNYITTLHTTENVLEYVYDINNNYNAIMEAARISEMRYYNDTGKSLFINEAGVLSNLIRRIVGFFKNLLSKIKSLFSKLSSSAESVAKKKRKEAEEMVNEMHPANSEITVPNMYGSARLWYEQHPDYLSIWSDFFDSAADCYDTLLSKNILDLDNILADGNNLFGSEILSGEWIHMNDSTEGMTDKFIYEIYGSMFEKYNYGYSNKVSEIERNMRITLGIDVKGDVDISINDIYPKSLDLIKLASGHLDKMKAEQNKFMYELQGIINCLSKKEREIDSGKLVANDENVVKIINAMTGALKSGYNFGMLHFKVYTDSIMTVINQEHRLLKIACHYA